jgi:hypothetical protein
MVTKTKLNKNLNNNQNKRLRFLNPPHQIHITLSHLRIQSILETFKQRSTVVIVHEKSFNESIRLKDHNEYLIENKSSTVSVDHDGY